MDRVITKILEDAAEQTGRTPEEVNQIMMHMFGFIRGKLDALDLSNVKTEEDLRKIKTNFNIPRIFKLYTTIKRVEYVKNKIGKINSPDEQRAHADNYAKVREGEHERTDTPRGAGTE